jgi:hypothetical protein
MQSLQKRVPESLPLSQAFWSSVHDGDDTHSPRKR